ncbi:cytochrome P450 71A1-like [Senna tora]|uniref:Cytochrome P450 71A1-like n=1 Tax=Senna tora TaxID=362788 RepID=A0A834TYX0_9FABA|nr:cytochrome P450 71A1-like [Senna tora]
MHSVSRYKFPDTLSLRKIRDLSSGGGGAGCVNLSELLIGTTNDIVSRCVLGDKFNTKADGRVVRLVRKVMVNLARSVWGIISLRLVGLIR